MANSRTEAVPFITARILCYHMSHKASYQYLGIRWIKRCCKWSADWKINKQSSKPALNCGRCNCNNKRSFMIFQFVNGFCKPTSYCSWIISPSKSNALELPFNNWIYTVDICVYDFLIFSDHGIWVCDQGYGAWSNLCHFRFIWYLCGSLGVLRLRGSSRNTNWVYPEATWKPWDCRYRLCS